MDERKARIGQNESLFREVNERVAEVNETFGVVTDAEFVCECGHRDCTDRIVVPLAEYEDVRRIPTYFLVKTGHQIPDVETVIEERGDHVVVAKHAGEAADVALETDPRA